MFPKLQATHLVNPKIFFFSRSKPFWCKTNFPSNSRPTRSFVFNFSLRFNFSITQSLKRLSPPLSALLVHRCRPLVIIHRGAAQNKSPLTFSSSSSSSSAQKLVISTPLLMVQLLGHFFCFLSSFCLLVLKLPAGKSDLTSRNGLRKLQDVL